jgi:tetratricopeptide (TPR) repeat protein
MSDIPSLPDIPHLLESSVPARHTPWGLYGLMGFAVVLMTAAWMSAQNPAIQGYVRFLVGLAMLGVVVATGLFSSHLVKQRRQEQQRVEAIEELVQLRRWDQALTMLESLLSQPMKTAGTRLQSLIYLASVLARYHRFGDAVAVQNYLLEHAEFDPGTTHGIKLMRTMAMLHEDQLVDADRAIGDIRRDAPDSAGLALIEIYRDVKTGHPDEAIEVFNAQAPALRAQLGHRIADAYALVARAYDMLSQNDQAAAAFEKATLLAPADELYRRYPEVAAMRDKYPTAAMPGEAS